MWEKLTLNKNSIKAETEKSFLIKLPKSEFCFGIHRNCVEEVEKVVMI